MFALFLVLWFGAVSVSSGGLRVERQAVHPCTALVNLCEFPPGIIRCYNGGTCHMNTTDCSRRIYCGCTPGFTGTKCKIPIVNTTETPTTTSETTTPTFITTTITETTTETSNTSVSTCADNPCITANKCTNGGTCVLNETSCLAECQCPGFLSGPTCSTCNVNPCSVGSQCVHGSCVSGLGCSFKCQCNTGYTGTYCETQFDQVNTETTTETTTDTSTTSVSTCGDNPCITANKCTNGGTCVLNDTSCLAECQCPGLLSGPTCSTCRTNPCRFAQPGSPCVHGSCVPGVSCSIQCQCYPGYTGDFCQTQSGQVNTNTSLTTQRSSEQSDVCPPGFPCLYGTCENTDAGTTCICNANYTGSLCNIPCYKQCGDNGDCYRANRTAPEICVCSWPYRGDQCTEKYVAKAEIPWKYWLIGSLLIFVLMLALLVLIGFCLVRRRNIFLLKVLYYFQPYEDDDGKQFDAFISYKSDPEDEHFVYRILYPELEMNRKFKLCLHQRDFMVGETIANNILWAIENSRRTILVLSPRYMNSDFTRFEYQIAHNEMLKQKHKVIPLLLEGITKEQQPHHEVDRTLASILKSITYIEWPGATSAEDDLAKFWKRLELSLPKKKSEDPEHQKTSQKRKEKSVSWSRKSDISSRKSDSIELGEIAIVSDPKDITIGSEFVEIPLDDNNVQRDETVYQNGTKDLKAFFKESSNDAEFTRMRDKASEYDPSVNM